MTESPGASLKWPLTATMPGAAKGLDGDALLAVLPLEGHRPLAV